MLKRLWRSHRRPSVEVPAKENKVKSTIQPRCLGRFGTVFFEASSQKRSTARKTPLTSWLSACCRLVVAEGTPSV
jgi:hypothetical protein